MTGAEPTLAESDGRDSARHCALASGSPLVLSLFPGIGLLDMAFEAEGFTTVRGPDLLWGGDVHRFHPPAGRFDGVIGGPPCQAHSTYAALNRAIGNKIAPDLVPEFVRVVQEAGPSWFVMENVPAVPDVVIDGYKVTRTVLNNRWLGEVQSRVRVFQFGTRHGARLHVELAALEAIDYEPACLASEGRSGQISNHKHAGRQKSWYKPCRDFAKFCELQGLPADFLEHAPLTSNGKYRVVGNGVPLPMGRAVARAVRAALVNIEVSRVADAAQPKPL